MSPSGNGTAMPTIPQVLEQSARDHPDRVAVSIVGGSALTYRELHLRVERFATWLKRRGITAGDRVAVLSDNGLTMFDTVLGSARIGAAVVPLGTGLARLQIETLLADAEPALVIVERAYADEVAAAGIDVLVSDSPEYAKALAAEPETLPYPSPQSIALIIYTSGTTGTAKGVCLTQDALVYNARVSARSQGMSMQDVYLSATPMYHASAGLRIYTTLLDAQTHIVMPSFDADQWLDVVETYGVTTTI
ncbi:MAG: class I adenylate-forming enzyme family protein, partial [Acidimicrobiia bacterium]